MVIGITGPSGSGKSTFTKLFSDYEIIDCDAVYNELLAKDKHLQDELEKTFGSYEKRELRKIVFTDENLKILNKLTFPYIKEEVRKRITKRCIIDASQLFEADLGELCDVTIAIVADKNICLERILKRDKIAIEEAEARMKYQKNSDFYADKADFIIENNGNREEGIQKWEKLNQRLQSMEECLTLQP